MDSNNKYLLPKGFADISEAESVLRINNILDEYYKDGRIVPYLSRVEEHWKSAGKFHQAFSSTIEYSLENNEMSKLACVLAAAKLDRHYYDLIESLALFRSPHIAEMFGVTFESGEGFSIERQLALPFDLKHSLEHFKDLLSRPQFDKAKFYEEILTFLKLIVDRQFELRKSKSLILNRKFLNEIIENTAISFRTIQCELTRKVRDHQFDITGFRILYDCDGMVFVTNSAKANILNWRLSVDLPVGVTASYFNKESIKKIFARA